MSYISFFSNQAVHIFSFADSALWLSTQAQFHFTFNVLDQPTLASWLLEADDELFAHLLPLFREVVYGHLFAP